MCEIVIKMRLALVVIVLIGGIEEIGAKWDALTPWFYDSCKLVQFCQIFDKNLNKSKRANIRGKVY